MTRRRLLSQSMVLALRGGGADKAIELIEEQTRSGQVAAVTLLAHGPSFTLRKAFGKAKTADAVFLLASLTKPMTATALMILADRKEVSLSDRVQRFIPEFRGDGREAVLIKHLLTHTSGLPDMLPEDQELRKAHAPLARFVERTCRTPLLFRPGSELRYQSMGILLAGEIVARVSKQSLPAFTKDHVFRPLGMLRTSIGLGGRAISQTMRCQVAASSDWDWNSSYWRKLGSPWGGALGTVDDMARFLDYFAHPDSRVLQTDTAEAMVTNQTEGLNKRWGLGWMLNNGQFGKGCSSATFGHSGSTGTLCWMDPRARVSFVLLTTKPAKESSTTLLRPVSNAISLAS
ncbi:MAG TPA: serine hydrolase domain-containing protein [Bryobacteraceae bacterium]|jgi:beta-lactamase class C